MDANPDFESIALITVLLQQDTLKELTEKEKASLKPILEKQKALIEKFRKANAPIIHCIRLTYANHQNLDSWRSEAYEDHYQINSDGSNMLSQVVGENPAFSYKKNSSALLNADFIEIQQNEFLIYQPRIGAFYYTSLSDFLEKNNISTLAVCGLNFPTSTLPTILEACERDFEIVFPSDSNLGYTPEDQKRLNSLKVRFLKTKELKLAPSLHQEIKSVNSTLLSKLEYTLGPIIGGFLLDSVSYSTAGMESFFTRIGINGLSTPVAFIIGLNVGYYLCRIYRVPIMKSLGLSLIAALYCCISSLSGVPVATILTAYFRFSSPRFKT